MTNGANCPRLFVSYSHRDADLQEEFKRHLDGRASGRNIEWWSDKRLPPGCDWNTEIEDAINKSSVAACLLTENFFGSNFIKDKELPYLLNRAEEKRLVVIPVIVRPAAFKSSPLARYQAWPDPSTPIVDMTEGQRHQFWESLIEEIERQMVTAAPGRWPNDQRLLPFGSGNIAFFPIADLHREPVAHSDFAVIVETVDYPIDPAASRMA
jgi:hypothetical protein